MTAVEQTDPGPRGIGGWLILPLLGTLVSPIILALAALKTAEAIGRTADSTLDALLVVETVFNLALAVGYIVAAVLLFRHKRSFPRLFSALLIIGLIGTVIDMAITVGVYDVKLDASDYRDLFRTIVSTAIWVPYMKVSRRVANTFVVD